MADAANESDRSRPSTAASTDIPSHTAAADANLAPSPRTSTDRSSVSRPSKPTDVVAHQSAAEAPVPLDNSLSADPVRRLVAAEELILELTTALDPLQQDLLNLVMPTEGSATLFAPQAELGDLVRDTNATDPSFERFVAGTLRRLTVLTENGQPAYWNVLFRRLAYWEHVKLSIVKGEFAEAGWQRFRTQISLAGLAHSDAGPWLDVRGTLDVHWQRAADTAPESSALTSQSSSPASTNSASLAGASPAAKTAWKIVRWQPISVVVHSSSHQQFRDVLAEAVPDESQRRPLLESQHWQYALHHYYPKRAARADSKIDDTRFFAISTAYHPGLSVVDLNRDGWDDLYIVDRWGTNQLLINQRDGTFRNDAAPFGLDIDGRSNASVFADFDNDGDTDLMVARGMERSLYLVNEDGRFVDRSSEWINHPLPYEATSVSAADYNGDGLLDVYFSTYHQDDIHRRLDADLSHPEHRIHRTLTPEHSAELKRRFQTETHSFINQVGPPNILLVNRGNGRFELAPENEQLALWRNSFQATWCDYDQDGDPDLYVANDFAADHLMRNDGSDGFHEVTQQLGMDQLGFGMGASWGDYDNDGQQDLYVSNMYSKAGRRITQEVDQLDPRIAQLANGNYLYDFDGQRFRLVSGLEPPKLTVARAGWAWGGQFFDANNDSFLDLYVASGYYTVPPPYETTVDL